MSTVIKYYAATNHTTDSPETSYCWVNGANSNSSYCRSRVKMTYDDATVVYTDSGEPYVKVTLTLQMARSNGDYDTHGKITQYFNDIVVGTTGTIYISEDCSQRSDSAAKSYIPSSYFTDILSKQFNLTLDSDGNFRSSEYSVRAESSVNNMVLTKKTFTISGSTVYRKRLPSMNITSQGGTYNSVYATCDVVDWGQNGVNGYNSDDYIKTAKLISLDSSEVVEENSEVEFSDNSKVEFSVAPAETQQHYNIVFSLIKKSEDDSGNNSGDSSFSANITANNISTLAFVPPTGPDNLNVIYEPSNDEPTVVSAYKLSWIENDWGTAPSEYIKSYILRIMVTSEYNTLEYIGYYEGDTSNSLTRNTSYSYYFNLSSSQNNIEISQSSWSEVLELIEPGDTLQIEVFSKVHYDNNEFLSSSSKSNRVGPIQDDQAKVRINLSNSIQKIGKVYIKVPTTEEDTDVGVCELFYETTIDDNDNELRQYYKWKKVKKLHIKQSSNWLKSKNP